MARKYVIRSKEEKLEIVKEVLAGKPLRAWEPAIRHGQVDVWVKKYIAHGEEGLAVKKKPGNPLARYENRKELSYEEQLLYKIELLKRELLKKEAEVARLKQQNGRKEGDTLNK